MYHSPAINPPTLEELKSVAAKQHLNIDDEDLKAYRADVIAFLKVYDRLKALQAPGLPVKYPSCPGYAPAQKDNPYNAWSRITETKGAVTGKLAGRTVAVKENVAIAGVPMTVSSQFMSGCISPYHATVVSRLLEAGAFIRGKATSENMCYSGSSFSSFPAPVPNPHDRERSAGGSSSGSAVLIASGEVDLAIGTDTGGSIRLPACWSGIVGFKPTFGLVPQTGVFPFERSLDHVGPMTRTVKDCALMLEVIAGYDGGLDPTQPENVTVPEYSQLLTGKISGIRIALIKEGFDGSEPDVAETVRNAAKSLESLGATVEEISFPAHANVLAASYALLFEGGASTFLNGGISSHSPRGYQDTVTHDFVFNASKSKADELPITMKRVLLGAAFIKEKFGNHFYGTATNVVRSIVAEYDGLFEKFNVLVMPTIKFKAPKLPKAGASVAEILEADTEMSANTLPFNATRHPALSINAGFSEGLPVGMTIVGNHFDDSTVLNVAFAYETIRDAKQ